MDDDRKEMANRLFATLTAMLEDAAAVAAAGQSSRANASSLRTQARRLQSSIAEAHVLTNAIAIILADEKLSKRSK